MTEIAAPPAVCGCTCHDAHEQHRQRCDGRCMIADQPCVYGCVWADTGHQRRAVRGNVCKRCYWRSRHRVTDLVAAHGWLGQQMTGIAAGWHEPVSGSADTDPAWLELHDLRDDIEWRLWWYADNLAADRGTCLVADHNNVWGTAGYILDNLHHIMASTWLVDFDEEVHDTITEVHGVTPWRREIRRMPVPCEECNLLTLVLRGGEDFIMCTNPDCRDIAVPFWRYDRYVKRLMEQHADKLPAAA